MCRYPRGDGLHAHGVDAEIITAIEAGTLSATVDELSDLAFALGVTMTSNRPSLTRFETPDRHDEARAALGPWAWVAVELVERIL